MESQQVQELKRFKVFYLVKNEKYCDERATLAEANVLCDKYRRDNWISWVEPT
jgi:hypothetical protein